MAISSSSLKLTWPHDSVIVETLTLIGSLGLLPVREFRAIPARSATASLTRSKAMTCLIVCVAQGYSETRSSVSTHTCT